YIVADFLLQQIRMQQITRANRPAGCLVLIGGPDASHGGSDTVLAELFLPGLLERHVVRQYEAGALRDKQPSLAIYAQILQLLEFGVECPWIDYGTIANDTGA